MGKNKACTNCFRHKKRCDRQRPCQRCIDSFIDCTEREVVSHRRPIGIPYTSKACIECNRSKTRCGDDRPCTRCVRIGLSCRDPPRRVISEHIPSSIVSAYMRPSSIQFPEPDISVMYEHLCASMKSISPFTIGELFTDDHALWFISTIGCLSSLIPRSETGNIARQLLERSALELNEQHLALQRLSYIDEPNRVMLESSCQLSKLKRDNPRIHLNHLDDKELVYYFFHVHTFNASKRYVVPPLYGVSVSIFMRNPESNKVVLSHFLSPVAETIFGYTSEQFAGISTEFGSTIDYSAEGFPQILCHFHNEDVLSYCSDSLRGFLNPGQEIEGRLRVIHSNCTFIPCTSTQVVVLYGDGGIRAIITQFIPDSVDP